MQGKIWMVICCMYTCIVFGLSFDYVFELQRSYVVFLLDHIGEDEEGEGISLHPRYPWEGSDRDYEYDEVCYLLLFA